MPTPTRSIALAVLLCSPVLAHAAGFDCAKAGTPVEKAICASPKVSALDGELGQAFRAALSAHPGMADALKLDQRHWLAERDAAVWSQLRQAPGKPLPDTVGGYRERIDVLKGLDTPAPAPLDRIRAALGKASDGSRDVLDQLGEHGVPVTRAKEMDLEKPGDFPYQPDKAVAAALAAADGSAQWRKLPGSPVSAVASLQGTMHCWEETPFRIEGTKAIAVEAPASWGADCMSTHDLAKIGDTYVALWQAYPSPDEMILQTAVWEGKAFGKDARLVARFDHALSVKGSACAPKQSPCDDFATTAMASVTRYDRSPMAATLARNLTGKDKATYDALVAAAKGGKSMAKADGGMSPALPDFGTGYVDGVMAEYSEDADVFPLTFRGETLLGYIDHGHVGWRVNNDWIVSAWRLKGDALEPVASVYVEVKRGAFLLSSMVPVPPPEEH
ncbi:lysozyme inhibitor LprI family protein [Xanthomonas sp. NCPPB 2632]|uniref:lysozyme inhibitor LprI family protein n=1 Tax=Xanthomonas sp. NCPPB 2632 TaxID=3240912 RepID=UPI003515F37F